MVFFGLWSVECLTQMLFFEMISVVISNRTLQQCPRGVDLMLDDQNALNQGHFLWKTLLPCPHSFTLWSRLIEPLRKSCLYIFKTCFLLRAVVNPNTSNQSRFYRILTGVRRTKALPRKSIKQLINKGHSLIHRDFVAVM
jgi:hypothetical protein